MKEIGKILVYLIATVLLGAAIAPVLFEAGEWVADHGALVFLKETSFQRFFDRAMLVAAVLLLWPLVKWLGIREWSELGLRRDARRLRHFAAGLVISIGSIVLLGGILIPLDIYHFRAEIEWHGFLLLPVTALAAALIEESLFRGALQGFVQRSGSPALAIGSVAALFSVIHFLKPPEPAAIAPVVGWDAGFRVIPEVFWQFHHPELVLGGFTTLLLFGLILGYARYRTASLWMPVGLHAGWIFGKFGFGKIAKRSGDLRPWFGADILVGIGPILLLLAAGAVVWLCLRHGDR